MNGVSTKCIYDQSLISIAVNVVKIMGVREYQYL